MIKLSEPVAKRRMNVVRQADHDGKSLLNLNIQIILSLWKGIPGVFNRLSFVSLPELRRTRKH